MVYINNKKEAYIVRFNDLDKLKNGHQEQLDSLKLVQKWVYNHLCKPHPELGRKGNVCPFTLPSIKKDHFWLGCYTSKHATANDICELMEECMDIFLQTAPVNSPESIFKTFVIAFPNITTPETTLLIDYTHELLKPDFVRNGLMLGQFYPNCNIGGVHNSKFMSLNSPIPLFVIRNMVVNDFLFLHHEEKFLADYIKYCSKKTPLDISLIESMLKLNRDNY